MVATGKKNDRRLDRLAVEVTGGTTLTQQRRLTAAQSERMWHQRWLLKFGAVVVVLVVAAGGIFWYVHSGRSAEAAAKAKQDAEAAELAAATREEVDGLIAESKLGDAVFALEKASNKGLPPWRR